MRGMQLRQAYGQCRRGIWTEKSVNRVQLCQESGQKEKLLLLQVNNVWVVVNVRACVR